MKFASALTELVQQARAAGLPISVAESIDAIRAAAAAGVEREPLREALAAALVKDEADRDAFDEVFDRFFAAAEPTRRKRAPSRSPGDGERGGRLGDGSGRSQRPSPEPKEERGPRPARKDNGPSAELRRRRRRRELLRKPFRDMDPAAAEELVALAAELGRRFRARFARRRRSGRRGRLDFRRTIRRSIARGGVPVDLVMRRRRPGKPDLVALCDLSGSVRHAAEFFAAVLAPAHGFFRRVRLLVFVDRAVDASFEQGRLVPHERIDFHAFSDYGRMLVDLEERFATAFTPSTVFVVLGDARTNRRPPRADVVSRLAAKSRTLWWLVPEAPTLWGKGDSAIAAYRSACDEVLACGSAAELLSALGRVAR
jgi:uncharacterized protein with von Willebrand factor type A (vWA) domain